MSPARLAIPFLSAPRKHDLPRINRDVVVALVLLVFCGAFIYATFYIRVTDYGTIQSSLWPRLILGALTIFSLGLLAQSVRNGGVLAGAPPEGGGFRGWLRRYRNALVCYALFLVFLVTLPILGMLLGGILFVFLTLTFLGRPSLRAVGTHAAISIGSVGAMWAIFTFGLNVFLPEGMLLSFQ